MGLIYILHHFLEWKRIWQCIKCILLHQIAYSVRAEYANGSYQQNESVDVLVKMKKAVYHIYKDNPLIGVII